MSRELIQESTTETIHENEDGKVTDRTIKSKTVKTKRLEEPDYIKIYTQMWCDFNQIPPGTAQQLFLYIAMHMSYAGPHDKDGGQVVDLSYYSDEIISELHISQATYYRLLKELCDCNAVRKLKKRGYYQVNPNYAGRGEWRYNPKFDQGGIENIKGYFDIKDGTFIPNIIWADDGRETADNQDFREGLSCEDEDFDVKASDYAMLQEEQSDTRSEEARRQDALPFDMELEAMDQEKEIL